MRDNDFYMYTQNRFIGGTALQNRAQYGFQMVTSAQYRQFHEMRSEMPVDVLQLFKANEIGFLRAPTKRKCRSLDPVSSLGMNLAEMFSIPNLQLMEEDKRETKAERSQRICKQRMMNNQIKIGQNMQSWDPFSISQASEDPEKTLFVSRLNYKTTQKQLRHEFERYGLVKSVYLVRDLQGNSRGYGFVQFENKQDFVHAYKNANQRKISGRRIVVDYERGRTLLKWRPRRFGGGLGDLRLTKQEVKRNEQNQRSKREGRNEKGSKSKSRSRQKRQRRHHDEHERNRDNKNRKDRKDKKDRKDRRDRRDYD